MSDLDRQLSVLTAADDADDADLVYVVKAGVERQATVGQLRALPVLKVGNFVAGTTPGTVVGAIEVFDADNNSLGFALLYDEVTP